MRRSEGDRILPNNRNLSRFFSYTMIGVLNTGLHWSVFFLLVSLVGTGQGPANLVAFACAVTFSFFANAKITFRSRASLGRYVGYVLFLGALAWGMGAAAEHVDLPPLVTLVAFSATSLVAGFLYSRYVIFAGADF